jgi:hypothetical protein
MKSLLKTAYNMGLYVAGPYFKNGSAYDWTKGTFSKFSKISETTPEKEVAWVHKNVYQKSAY